MGRKQNPQLAEVWQDRLARQRQSGLSVAEFCRRVGVSQPSFYQWKARLAKDSSKPARARQSAQRPARRAAITRDAAHPADGGCASPPAAEPRFRPTSGKRSAARRLDRIGACRRNGHSLAGPQSGGFGACPANLGRTQRARSAGGARCLACLLPSASSCVRRPPICASNLMAWQRW